MKVFRFILSVACLGFMLVSACSEQEDKPAQASAPDLPAITIMTHDSFSISKEVAVALEEECRVKLTILKSGDAGEALNKAVLTKNNPLADIFYGVDNTFLSRALDEDIFLSHAPAHLADVEDSLKLDPQNRLIPVDYGDVCVNFDLQWFEQAGKPIPAMLEDLTDPKYKGLLVVENPATSSPGLAFLLATISRFGPDGYIDYWKKLKANDLLITNGWKEAYWGKFTAASQGNRPLVVSYASSPAAEVFYAETKPEKAPTGVMTENGSAFRQIEFAGILKGTSRPESAKKVMDFLLSPRFQEDIPLQMFVFPANTKAGLPTVFREHAKITREPARLDPGQIDENRDNWIREWTENML
ncbi:thiamine ABC transporter substrate-binding protein [Desulfospira joergensenii]|uniref:thiamine ABC transporter substrate-binding protein n=1 Tax=Desulfospira joergensenii TaxID=53329 RepID=UPI0003B6CE8D|nr:thiamine ABC transporter substrate-binding protein [Desulfospira joergensenii]